MLMKNSTYMHLPSLSMILIVPTLPTVTSSEGLVLEITKEYSSTASRGTASLVTLTVRYTTVTDSLKYRPISSTSVPDITTEGG